MVLKQWLQFLPMYSGRMWDTMGFSTVSTSPMVMSLVATANLPLPSSYLKLTASLIAGYTGFLAGKGGNSGLG